MALPFIHYTKIQTDPAKLPNLIRLKVTESYRNFISLYLSFTDKTGKSYSEGEATKHELPSFLSHRARRNTFRLN